MATLGSVAAAQDETPDVRFSVLPAVRGHDGNTHIRASTSVLTSVTYTGETPVENCRVTDETMNYANPNNGFEPTALVWIDHTETDATGNVVAPTNSSFDMAPGQTRHFVLSAENAYCGVWTCTVRFRLDCAGPDGARTGNSADRYYSRGLPIESFRFNIGPTPMADVIPILVTPSGDGYLRFSQTGGVAAASVAAVNIGEDQDVTVIANATGGMVADICPTGSDGRCLLPRQRAVTVRMNRDEIHLFSVRVRDVAEYSIPRSPAQHRLTVRFVERGVPELSIGIRLSGDTSVALDEPPATSTPGDLTGVWHFNRCLNDTREAGEYYPGDETSGQRLLIASNGLALAIGQASGIDFCNERHIQFMRFDSVGLPLGPSQGPTEIMRAWRPAGDASWSVFAVANNPRVGVEADPSGTVLTFDEEMLFFRPTSTRDIEADIEARRDFNTAFLPDPVGQFRMEYRMNDAPIAMTIDVAEDLSFTTTDTLNCRFAGQLVRDDAFGNPGLYQITMTATDCAAPIFTHSGDYEGLVLFESTDTGFALSGAVYGERVTVFTREQRLFPIWAYPVAE